MKILLALLLCAASSYAHQSSMAFISLTRDGAELRVRWDIALRDLEFAVGLDADGDSKITWGEVRARLRAIESFALPQFSLSTGRIEEALIEERTTGAYLVLQWVTPARDRATFTYNFLFDLDPSHQCFIELPDRSTAILTKENRTIGFRGEGSTSFLKQGVVHIFAGIDHVFFLIALLLPAVWKRTSEGWKPVGTLRSAGASVFKVVTSFTVAHSITLALSAFNLVRLPSALIESIIALSVILAAANNLHPLWNERSWMVAFGFGLIHGFGFASVLGELGLAQESLVASLLGFNIGVEMGQLMIVLLFLPLAFLLRETLFYRAWVVRFGSAAIILVAALWFVERAFAVAIF